MMKHNSRCPHPQTIPQVRLLIFLTSSTIVSPRAKLNSWFPGTGWTVEVKCTVGKTQNTHSASHCSPSPPPPYISPHLPPSTPLSAAAAAALIELLLPPSSPLSRRHQAAAIEPLPPIPPLSQPPPSSRCHRRATLSAMPALGRWILLIWRHRLVRSWVFLGSSSSLGELRHTPPLAAVVAIPSGTVRSS